MAQHLNFPNVLQNYQNLYANKQEVNDPPKKGIYIVGINTSAPLPCVPCNNSNKTQSNKYIG